MSILREKVALVTGGGRGIGKAIALGLAHEGCDVAVVARTAAEVEQTSQEIQQLGRRSIALTCDISDSEQVIAAYMAARKHLGVIDVLVNNAATIQPMGPTVSIDPDTWVNTLNNNLGGSFRWIHMCLPDMLERTWGRIINISSAVASGTGMQNGNAYSVTKAGVEMMIRNLAHEIEGSGVTANVLRPGLVDTSMQTYVRDLPSEQAGETSQNFFKAAEAEGKLLPPALPARVVVRLLQGETTGEVISIYDQRGQELLA